METPHGIWALLDGRAGNDTQTLGLAQALGTPYTKKRINYTNAVLLPNRLRGTSLIGFDEKHSDPLQAPFPDMVIGTGRRLAPLIHWIKNQSPDTFTVQLMHPQMPLEQFDCVMLPSHDDHPERENVVDVLGAPHRLQERDLKRAAHEWAPHLTPWTEPVTAVLLGGNTKAGKLRKTEIEQLLNQLRQHPGGLWITVSRRTPALIIDWLRKTVKAPDRLTIPGEGANPYLAYLALADRIVVSGESVSMVSEACFTGKPVYIFSPEHTMKPKHTRLRDTLITHGYAVPVAEYPRSRTPDQHLDETSRLADVIKDRYVERRKAPMNA